MYEAIPNKRKLRIMCASGVHCALFKDGSTLWYDTPIISVTFNDESYIKLAQHYWECKWCVTDSSFPNNGFRDYNDPLYHGALPTDNYFKKLFTDWQGKEYKTYGDWFYVDIESDYDLILKTIVINSPNQITADLNYDNKRYPVFTLIGAREFKFTMPSRIYVNTELLKQHILNDGITVFVGCPLEYLNWTNNPFFYDMLPVWRELHGLMRDFCGCVIDSLFFRDNYVYNKTLYFSVLVDGQKYTGSDIGVAVIKEPLAAHPTFYGDGLAAQGNLSLKSDIALDGQTMYAVVYGAEKAGSIYTDFLFVYAQPVHLPTTSGAYRFVKNKNNLNTEYKNPRMTFTYKQLVNNYNVGTFYLYNSTTKKTIHLYPRLNKERDSQIAQFFVYAELTTGTKYSGRIRYIVKCNGTVLLDRIIRLDYDTVITYPENSTCLIQYRVDALYYDEEYQKTLELRKIILNNLNALINLDAYGKGKMRVTRPLLDGVLAPYNYDTYCLNFPSSYLKIIHLDSTFTTHTLPIGPNLYVDYTGIDPFWTILICCKLKDQYKSRSGILGLTIISTFKKCSNESYQLNLYLNPRLPSKVKIKVNGEWKEATPYVKINGSWKQVKPWIKHNGYWKSID